MKDKNCLNCIKKCKEKIDPEFCYCDDWSNNIKDLTFEERAKLFKEAVEKAEKKYGVEIDAGYINSYDDSENLIIQEMRGVEVINEIYFQTLSKEL